MPISPDTIIRINHVYGVRSATCADVNQGCALSSEHTGRVETPPVAYNACGSSTVINASGKRAYYRFKTIQGVKYVTAIEGEPPSYPNSNSTFIYGNQGCQFSSAAIADQYCKDGGDHSFLLHRDVAIALNFARLNAVVLAVLFLLCLALSSAARADYQWFVNESPKFTGSSPAAACEALVPHASPWPTYQYRYDSYYIVRIIETQFDCYLRFRSADGQQLATRYHPIHIIRGAGSCDLPKVYDNQTGECKAPGSVNVGQICQERNDLSASDPLLVQVDGSCKKLSRSPMNKGTPHSSSCTGPNSLAGNPINFSTGNKLQIETDLSQIKNSDLEITRRFNSIDGLWRHNYSKELRTVNTILILTDNDGAESYFRIAGELATPIHGYGRILKQENDAWTLYNSDNSSDTFNSAGRVSAHRSANLSYDITYSNEVIEVTEKSGFKITITEDTQKQPLKITTPNATFTYSYNDINRLVSVIKTANGIQSKRTYSYGVQTDPNLLTSITDERGIRYATWTYDGQGRAISSEHAGGAEKVTVAYNADGSSTVTNALGKRTTYRFQTIQGIRRITAIEGEPSANCPNSNSTFTYDDRGLVKTRTDNKGHVTTFDYNERGLEVSRTEAFGTPQARTITTTWHPTLFLPASVTEPDRITTYSYDDQGRQLSQSVSQR
ncbi:DUF6531 domain-containing protein [Metapseudomonas otitidis]|uniref:DUF6531 domain-containing protein n=1 Tax=Metapseudomonas otitidis TaxID=319939 RepID=UPI00244BEFEE|nr:DUF6531 domain-containing protein [Pseudomonas otitidis]MDH0336617.1 DUF6531 domain-containing protein [Pseudomonas otitidis]